MRRDRDHVTVIEDNPSSEGNDDPHDEVIRLEELAAERDVRLRDPLSAARNAPRRQRQVITVLYEPTLNTTSCSRACSATFRPNSSFGRTSVTGA
jgi:hypothetical protein